MQKIVARRIVAASKRRIKRILAPYRDVATLAGSPLFDHRWYSHVSGVSLSRRRAARHYLAFGQSRGHTPHALFDGSYFEERSPELRIEGVDPLVRYIRGRCWRSPIHPLFHITAYLDAHPSALEYPTGPIGHYLNHGAAKGASPNEWYRVALDAEPRGLVDWMWHQVSEYRRDLEALAAAYPATTPDHDAINWTDTARLARDPEVVTVAVGASGDGARTSRAVELIATHAAQSRERVEIVVVDNGNSPAVAVPLRAVKRFDGVQILHLTQRMSPALANNVVLTHAAGATVVFLHADTEPLPGWLAPLREAMKDVNVLAAQSLLLSPTGSIDAAGLAFSGASSLPHSVLRGHPWEDASGLGGVPFSALSGAALAVRTDDLITVHGFDGVFQRSMEDVDLCLRLKQLREGTCHVLADSRVIHVEAHMTGDTNPSPKDQAVFLERWDGRLPVDDQRIWGAAGYAIAGSGVVRRAGRASVIESAPCLRWAIKNPAPFGPEGEAWGDTYYARHLAEALEKLGQEVVIDHRDEFNRATGPHDDVVLVLRGLTPYTPAPRQVSMLWVISHPDLLTQAEGRDWDRVYVASVAYAPQLAAQWGRAVSPLLQATDPHRFHPDVAEPDSGHPVLFVGNSRNEPRPIVMQAVNQGLDLAVIGRDWEQFVPPEVIGSEFLANDMVGAAYRSAGILLNDHWEDMRTQGFISNRLFDAVAAGARVITDDVAGLRDVFGVSVQVAHNAEELAALVRAPDRDGIFGNDDERRAAAAVVARDHSFDARAAVLLRDALESWRAKERSL